MFQHEMLSALPHRMVLATELLRRQKDVSSHCRKGVLFRPLSCFYGRRKYFVSGEPI